MTRVIQTLKIMRLCTYSSYKIIVLLLSKNLWWIVILNHTFKFIKINLQWVFTLTFKTVLHPTITVYSSKCSFISCADATLVCNTRSTRQPLYGRTEPSTYRLCFTRKITHSWSSCKPFCATNLNSYIQIISS